VRVVELRSLVLLDDEGKEAAAVIFGLAFACLGLLVQKPQIPITRLASFLMDLPGLNALDCELS
jgi:hypothetical protein